MRSQGSAPDVYETPDLTDDNSTVPGTTVQSHSEDDRAAGDDEEAGSRVIRPRFRLDQSRSRFLLAQIDASAVDFSDRVGTKRRSYKSYSRKVRILPDCSNEYSANSIDGNRVDDGDDDEAFDRKIARLRREVEEAKEEYANRKKVKPADGSTSHGTVDGSSQLSPLSDALDRLSQVEALAWQAAVANPARVQRGLSHDSGKMYARLVTSDMATFATTHQYSHALIMTADFDRRLTVLEKVIGVAAFSGPEWGFFGAQRTLLTSIAKIFDQVLILSQASIASLDTTSRRVRTPTQEILQLNEARQRALTVRADAPPASIGKSEQVCQINDLYGVLPTIESLIPLLLPLLDRLRSLRVIHSSAALASNTLDHLERQQHEMATELKIWTEGLVKVEGAITDSAATLEENRSHVDLYVKELEVRMAKLGGA